MNSRYEIGNGALPADTAIAAVLGQRRFRRGQIVFNSQRDGIRPYRVASGEVVVLRNGSMVDIIEPGESIDPNMWSHAVGVAWTDCQLVGLG